MSIILAIGGWQADSDPIRSSHLLINPGANINRSLQPHFHTLGKKCALILVGVAKKTHLPKILSLLQQCRSTQTLRNKISHTWQKS